MATKEVVRFKNYMWRVGTHADKSWAPIFGEHVDQLEKGFGRTPTARDVLESARPEESPIHDLFQWKDAEAAEKFRTMQASVFLTALTVKVEMVSNGKKQEVIMPVRVSLNKSTGNKMGGGRTHINDILGDASLRKQMLEMAADELLSIRRRYSYIRDLAKVFHEVDVVIDEKVPHLAMEHKKKVG